MTTCAAVRQRIAPYVDGELAGAQALELEVHLTECPECRAAYEGLRHAVDAVRGARQMYQAPESSYASARAIVVNHHRRQLLRRALPIAAAAIVLVAVILSTSATGRSKFEKFAAQSHLRYGRGVLKLDVGSQSPEVVSAWLEPRVPFRLQLPNYPEGGARKRYSLAGARLMRFGGEEVAYLAYEMDRKPISLLISSSERVMPSAGEGYRSGGLTFYFSSHDGYRVITWTDKGLTYAQVSDLDVKGAESCVICHGAEADRGKFEGLGR